MDTKLQSLIAKVEADLSELRAYAENLDGESTANMPWFFRPGKLLWEIMERGGEVTTEEFYEIGDGLGYDRRGLGGFFKGTGATLEMVLGGPNSGNRRLTPIGNLAAQKWFQLFGQHAA